MRSRSITSFCEQLRKYDIIWCKIEVICFFFMIKFKKLINFFLQESKVGKISYLPPLATQKIFVSSPSLVTQK